MSEETKLRNWGWGLKGEPVPWPDEDKEEFTKRHKDWLTERYKFLERKYDEFSTILSSSQKEIEDAERKIESYEKILAKRKGLSIYEPGTVVELPSLNTKGKILTVTIYPGGSVMYTVGYPRNGVYYRSLLPASEVTDEIPLAHPSELKR